MRLVILLTKTIDKDECRICKGSKYYYQGDIEEGMMMICNCPELKDSSHPPHTKGIEDDHVTE